MKHIFLLLMVEAILVFSACLKKTEGNTPPPSKTDCNGIDNRFADRVWPIIQLHCAAGGCHANGSSNSPGALTNFSLVSNAAVNIRSAVSSGKMPKGGSLSVQDKNTILCWIASGSANT